MQVTNILVQSIHIFLMVTGTSTLVTAYMMDSYSKVTNFVYLPLVFENMLFANYIQEVVVVTWDVTRHLLLWMITIIGCV